MFKPFIDPDNIIERITWRLPDAPDPNTGEITKVYWWNRISGETFDTLSLVPSVDMSGVGHWHGHIVNGEIV